MNKEQRWKDGYTISNCTKQMTSKEATETAIRELIEYHVEKALETASKTDCIKVSYSDDEQQEDVEYNTNDDDLRAGNGHFFVDKELILNAYPSNLII